MKTCLIILSVIIGSQALCRKGFASNVDKITLNLLFHGRDNDNRTVKDIKLIPLERKQHPIICDGCEIVMNYVIRYRKNDASNTQMLNFLSNLCVKFLEWSNIYCYQHIQHEINAILYILDNRKNITAKRICSFIFVHMNCTDPDAEKWEIPLSPYTSLRNSKWPGPTYRGCIFSDVHFDPEYHAEKNAICEEPVCCHHGIPNNITDGAGYWADNRNCDLPWRTVVEFTQLISKDEGSANYFCGDVFTQADWRSTKKRVTKSLKLFYSLVSNTNWLARFYPSLGEHDTHPANLWLIYDDVDPYGQLQWLVEQLENMQKINSKVYIVQHVPVGSIHCYRQWSEQYARILHRYIFVVASIFYGHEHHANYKFLVHPSDIYQMLQGFSAGSLLAESFTNPSYMRIITDRIPKTIHDACLNFVDVVKANNKIWNRPVMKTGKNLEGWFNTFVSQIRIHHKIRYQLKNMFHEYDDIFYDFYVSHFDKPYECDFRCRKVKSCSTWVMTTDDAIRCRYYP